MPRKTIDQQHNGRFVRHLHSDNHCRRIEQWNMHRGCRYHLMDGDCTEEDWGPWDHAVIRNPELKPLLHKGRKP